MYKVCIIFSLLLASVTTIRAQNTIEMNDSEVKNRLYKDVEYLTSVKPSRNYKNLEILNEVANYIITVFKGLKCRTYYQTFQVDGKTYKNVIADFGPIEGPIVVVGAHYDVAGEQPGADDNASAVAGLLEVARFLDNQKELKSRIQLVAYSLEEPPYFATESMGSAYHVNQLIKAKEEVKAMICLEMIGYFSDKPDSQNFPDESMKKIYPTTGNFIVVVGTHGQEPFTAKIKSLMKEGCSIDVQSIILPANNSLGSLSDHRNYWKHKIKAVMINDTSFLRNPNYHQKTDSIETLDFEKMTEVVKGVCHVTVQL